MACGALTPYQCMSCGLHLSHYEEYIRKNEIRFQHTDKFSARAQVLNSLGVNNICCRTQLLTTIFTNEIPDNRFEPIPPTDFPPIILQDDKTIPKFAMDKLPNGDIRFVAQNVMPEFVNGVRRTILNDVKTLGINWKDVKIKQYKVRKFNIEFTMFRMGGITIYYNGDNEPGNYRMLLCDNENTSLPLVNNTDKPMFIYTDTFKIQTRPNDSDDWVTVTEYPFSFPYHVPIIFLEPQEKAYIEAPIVFRCPRTISDTNIYIYDHNFAAAKVEYRFFPETKMVDRIDSQEPQSIVLTIRFNGKRDTEKSFKDAIKYIKTTLNDIGVNFYIGNIKLINTELRIENICHTVATLFMRYSNRYILNEKMKLLTMEQKAEVIKQNLVYINEIHHNNTHMMFNVMDGEYGLKNKLFYLDKKLQNEFCNIFFSIIKDYDLWYKEGEYINPCDVLPYKPYAKEPVREASEFITSIDSAPVFSNNDQDLLLIILETLSTEFVIKKEGTTIIIASEINNPQTLIVLSQLCKKCKFIVYNNVSLLGKIQMPNITINDKIMNMETANEIKYKLSQELSQDVLLFVDFDIKTPEIYQNYLELIQPKHTLIRNFVALSEYAFVNGTYIIQPKTMNLTYSIPIYNAAKTIKPSVNMYNFMDNLKLQQFNNELYEQTYFNLAALYIFDKFLQANNDTWTVKPKEIKKLTYMDFYGKILV